MYYIINKNSETTTRDEKVFDILKIIDIIRNTLEEKNISDISKKNNCQNINQLYNSAKI